MSTSKIYEIAFQLGGQVSPEMYAAFNAAKNQLNEFEGGTQKSNLAMKTMAVGAAAASAAIAGIATGLGAAVKAAADFDGAMKQVQASTGSSVEEMAEFKGIAKNLYNNNLGEDWNDVADALSQTRSVTQLVGRDLENATANAIAYRDTFGEDISQSVKATDTMMKNFGISSSQAYNLLAQGAQKGLNKSDELMDTANEYAPYFSQLGFSANDMFNTFSTGLKNGAFNLDKVGDAVKEFNIRAKDGSKTTMDAYAKLGLQGDKLTQTFAKGGPGAQKAFSQVVNAISKVKDPAKQSALSVALFGTQAEDLEIGVIKSMGHVKGQFDMTKNTMEEVKNIKYDTLGNAIQGIGRQLLTELILPVGDKLLPVFQTLSDYLRTSLPTIKKQLSNTFGPVGKMIKEAFSNTSVFSTFGEKLQPLISTVSTIFSTVGITIRSFFSKNGPLILHGFTTVATVLGTTFKGVLSIIRTVLPIIQPILTSMISFIMQTIQKVTVFWKTNGTQIIQAVQNVFQGISAIIKFLSPVIFYIINSVWSAVKGVISGALGVIMGLIKIFAGLFTLDFRKLWEGIKQVFSSGIQLVWNLFTLMFYGKIIGGIRSLAKGGITLIKNMWGSIKTAFSNGVSNAWQKVLGLGPKIKEGFVVAKNAAIDLAKSMWSGIQKQFDKIVSGAKALPGKMGTAIKNMAHKAVDGAISMGNKLLSGIGKIVNGVVNGLNWITDKLGFGGQLPNWKVPQYANGTNGHPGGLAILGDGGGPELYHTPNGQVGLSPGTDTMMYLPRGTHIIPHRETAQILREAIPMYKYGDGVSNPVKTGLDWLGKVGSSAVEKTSSLVNKVKDKTVDIFSLVTSPKKMFNAITEKFGVVKDIVGINGAFKNVASGAYSFVKHKATSWIDKKIEKFMSSMSNVGGSAKAWIPQIQMAAAQMGEKLSSGELAGIVAQIQRESSGNASIIQSSAVWDVNTANGNPARGLLQYIPQTFAAYAVPGFTNIMNGYHQLLAFFNNRTWRSDLPYGKSGWGPKGGRKYAAGGTITSEEPFTMNERGGELMQLPIGSRIFSHAKSKDLIRKAAEYGTKAKQTITAKGQSYKIQLNPQFVFHGDTNDEQRLRDFFMNASEELRALIIKILEEIDRQKRDTSFE